MMSCFQRTCGRVAVKEQLSSAQFLILSRGSRNSSGQFVDDFCLGVGGLVKVNTSFHRLWHRVREQIISGKPATGTAFQNLIGE
jgi:hypothetical protein